MSRNKIPDVSVITPVYNTRTCFLDRYFKSLISYNQLIVEIIIVNDGSNLEETKKWLRDLEAIGYEYVKVVNLEKNQGISRCRNIALDIAHGKYVVILDSDDYFDENYLRDMYEIAEKKGVDLVASGYTWVTEDEDIIKKFKLPHIRNSYFLLSVPCSARFFRRSILEKSRIRYPEDCLLEDAVFNISLIGAINSFTYLETEGFFNREHVNRFSHSKEARFAVKYDQIPFLYAEKIIQELNKKDPKCKWEVRGELINIMASVACIFNANNNAIERELIISKSADFIRRLVPNSMICSLKYMMFSYSSFWVKFVQFGYVLFIKMGIEKFYADIIAKILKRFLIK